VSEIALLVSNCVNSSINTGSKNLRLSRKENIMRKKILIAVVALMLFAFSIAAFAYTKNSTTKTSCPMSDCCKDGVCKLNGECCKDKDFCPMKSNLEATKDCPMHQKTEVNR
jgi:hypothetical protein